MKHLFSITRSVAAESQPNARRGQSGIDSEPGLAAATGSSDSLVTLVCPDCKQKLTPSGTDWECAACHRPFAHNQGILSFLTPEERFNEGAYEADQIAAWTASARLRDKIRASKFLTFLNLVRIKFSLSGRRDRIFRDEMLPGAGPHRLILDLGCGGGRHYFCEYGRVIGIDPVLPLLQMAGKIYDEVYQTNGFKLPFADNTFDYVVSSDVLGHIGTENKDLLFSEIYRVLKKGGRTVHCSEADSDNVWFRFAHKYPDLFAVHFVEKPGHISLEKPTQIRARFLKHGFKEIVFRRLESNIPVPGELAALFDNEYRSKSKWISACVAIDKLLHANFAFCEMLNFLLEPLARLEDWLSSPDSTSGALIAYEKV
jgi:ubiquinone/menaquinone biosynthesis C-methylase UbiE